MVFFRDIDFTFKNAADQTRQLDEMLRKAMQRDGFQAGRTGMDATLFSFSWTTWCLGAV